MSNLFFTATAEQVVSAVEAIVVNNGPAKVEFVASFSDLPSTQAEAALKLATDLGLLTSDAGLYKISSPLCRFLATPSQEQKASILRVILESYEPFLIFRERLVATSLSATAAKQTKVALEFDTHHHEIEHTLISLGTYSHALIAEGGGRYRPNENPLEAYFKAIAKGCENLLKAKSRIRDQLGRNSAENLSREEVIIPLSNALIRAASGDSTGAVVYAGNAVESFLDDYARRMGASLQGATGINSKLEKIAKAKKIPKKLVFMGKYLGHIRNAADHGIDPEISASWTIREATGMEYVFVACSFISATIAFGMESKFEI